MNHAGKRLISMNLMKDKFHMPPPSNIPDRDNNLKYMKPEAVILDLDSIITNMATLRIKSWEKTFRRYIKENNSKSTPFSKRDYNMYFEGRPEFNSLLNFLGSRGILLPEGTDKDPVNANTIWSLYKLKRQIFTEILEKDNMELSANVGNALRDWRSAGLKCGVVSSGWDCRTVLEKTDFSDQFDILIDDFIMKERGLGDKLFMNYLLEVAKELESSPERCVVIVDSLKGVQAGTVGNFSLVAGVDHKNMRKVLIENGADIVVDDIKHIDLNNKELKMFFIEFAPSLFTNLEDFFSLFRNKRPALFLDYDGTLTPIVKNPSEAVLSEDMRSVLTNCSKMLPVAIISGRDLDDLKQLVRISNIIYGGSHGFRITGPGGLYMEHPDSDKILPGLNGIEDKLHKLFDNKIAGIKIERKRYAIAVHYRNVAEEDVPFIIREVENTIDQSSGFRKGEGKKVIEVRPDVDWHKGRAIGWLLERREFNAGEEVIPIYIGDDLTDEDVFENLPESGIGILAGFHGGKTSARYSLKNVYQVRLFIEMLANYNQR
jgi:trehalose 6-phosphate phosphatase